MDLQSESKSTQNMPIHDNLDQTKYYSSEDALKLDLMRSKFCWKPKISDLRYEEI